MAALSADFPEFHATETRLPYLSEPDENWSSIERCKIMLKHLNERTDRINEKIRGRRSEKANNHFDWVSLNGKLVRKYVSNAERTRIRTIFDCLDSDKGGTIGLAELAAAFHMLGMEVTKAELKTMMSKVDSAGTGELTLEQFANLLQVAHDEEGHLKHFVVFARAYHVRRTVASVVFQIIDKDGSGCIDVHELSEALSHLGFRYSKEEVDKLMESVDPEQPGEITMNEFVSLLNHIEFTEEDKRKFAMERQARSQWDRIGGGKKTFI